jgi:hypothetical protein
MKHAVMFIVHRSSCPSQRYALWKSTTWCANVGNVMMVCDQHLRKSTCFLNEKTWAIVLETNIAFHSFETTACTCSLTALTLKLPMWKLYSKLLLWFYFQILSRSCSYPKILLQHFLEIFGWDTECKTRLLILVLEIKGTDRNVDGTVFIIGTYHSAYY